MLGTVSGYHQALVACTPPGSSMYVVGLAICLRTVTFAFDLIYSGIISVLRGRGLTQQGDLLTYFPQSSSLKEEVSTPSYLPSTALVHPLRIWSLSSCPHIRWASVALGGNLVVNPFDRNHLR